MICNLIRSQDPTDPAELAWSHHYFQMPPATFGALGVKCVSQRSSGQFLHLSHLEKPAPADICSRYSGSDTAAAEAGTRQSQFP